jgi:hypothetical protein
MDKVGDS